MTTPADIEKAFPEAYAAILEIGATKERKRCTDHLEYGARGIDYRRAHDAIRTGAALTPELVGLYFSDANDRRAIVARQEEADEAGAAVDGAARGRQSFDGGATQVADLVEGLMDGRIPL